MAQSLTQNYGGGGGGGYVSKKNSDDKIDPFMLSKDDNPGDKKQLSQNKVFNFQSNTDLFS